MKQTRHCLPRYILLIFLFFGLKSNIQLMTLFLSLKTRRLVISQYTFPPLLTTITFNFKPAFTSLNTPTQSRTIQNIWNIAIPEYTICAKVPSTNKKASLLKISIIFKLSINKQSFHEFPKKFEKNYSSIVNFTTSSKTIGVREKLIMKSDSELKATLGNTLIVGF